MRTLAVDALRLAGPRTAMGRYLEALAREWSCGEQPFDRIVFHVPAGVPLEGLPRASHVRWGRPSARKLPLALWQQAVLPARTRTAAMLFCPAYIAPLARRGPWVVANHGIYEGLPGEFSSSDRLRTVPLYRYAVRHADRVIANSGSTRDDIVRHLGASADRIDVVFPGTADLFFAPHDSAEIRRTVAEQLGDPDARFALFVGKLSRRRHIPELIEGFAAARARLRSDHRLLIVGPDTTGIDVPARAIAHQIENAVTYVPHLDQPALAHLYAAAEVFVLPTPHEGISWTMLEAMASGAPVLTVRHAALDEGGRDAVLAVEAAGVEHLAGGLERLLSDPAERARLSAAGRAQAGRFTWRAAASATMAVLDRYAAPADR